MQVLFTDPSKRYLDALCVTEFTTTEETSKLLPTNQKKGEDVMYMVMKNAMLYVVAPTINAVAAKLVSTRTH